MDTNITIVVIAIIFAVIIISGLIIYRRKAKVGIELPGSKLNFEGTNDSTIGHSKPRNVSNGIFGNLSIGKTRMGVKGSGTIANNKSIGDTELTKEDASLNNESNHKTKSEKA